MPSAINSEKDYLELLVMIVCIRDSKECMVHHRPSCPGVENLIRFLKQTLLRNIAENEAADESSEENDDEGNETMTFKQWTRTDQADLISQTVSIEEFIEELAEKLNNITSHSYIAHVQSAYLKKLKEDLQQMKS